MQENYNSCWHYVQYSVLWNWMHPAKMPVSSLVYRLEPQNKLHCEWFKLQYIVLEQYTFILKQMLSPANTNLDQDTLPFTTLEKNIISLASHARKDTAQTGKELSATPKFSDVCWNHQRWFHGVHLNPTLGTLQSLHFRSRITSGHQNWLPCLDLDSVYAREDRFPIT